MACSRSLANFSASDSSFRIALCLTARSQSLADFSASDSSSQRFLPQWLRLQPSSFFRGSLLLKAVILTWCCCLVKRSSTASIARVTFGRSDSGSPVYCSKNNRRFLLTKNCFPLCLRLQSSTIFFYLTKDCLPLSLGFQSSMIFFLLTKICLRLFLGSEDGFFGGLLEGFWRASGRLIKALQLLYTLE